MPDHDFDLTHNKAVCVHCGLTMAEWVDSRLGCARVETPDPPDPIWDAVVATARGTNAAAPAQDEQPCES